MGVDGVVDEDDYNRVEDIVPTVPESIIEGGDVVPTEPYLHDDHQVDVIV